MTKLSKNAHAATVDLKCRICGEEAADYTVNTYDGTVISAWCEKHRARNTPSVTLDGNEMSANAGMVYESLKGIADELNLRFPNNEEFPLAAVKAIGRSPLRKVVQNYLAECDREEERE